tara:strand:- start:1347 stop:1841 length:495 start_codon:yes stop_codon:yes gene_type:complete
MSNPQYNGRVFFEKQYPQYNLFSESDNNKTDIAKSIGNVQELTPLSQKYFSSNNLNKIQNGIIQKVRIMSGYEIGRQDDLQVQIIQRSIYLSYSKNQYNNIDNQIDVLNNKVIDEAVKKIIPEIKQYLQYIKDISSPRTIMSHPVHISSRTQLGGFDSNIPGPM